ncbi:arsenite efflux MFS transporter ArsK [Mesorhizobium sp. L-8-3]|uniref:arsenite efflux MFS transporter ArsK n=1 Tax=Mesorhizobium sp. L-8-3 TaxID=2744522 RepID=UPI001925C0A0|nr:arsenite efflux MFS transporter ArsK [Mesorhizobium sp. L-8-3]BCH25638.1 MFS transporter [Mesorhizobium sp. L-8-3]
MFHRVGSIHLPPTAVVWMLGATQIIGYGTLYYSFAILAGDMAGEFHWPVSWVYGAFSVALLFGGLVAPAVGRYVDSHGAALVMAVGSIASAVALALTAIAPNPIAFTLRLIAIEIASTLVLYDAAFAAIVQTAGAGARKRITHLTLIAGFASTLFWPLTTWLHGLLDWRGVLLLFASANALICFPFHLVLSAARAGRTTVGMPSSSPLLDGPELPVRLQPRALILVTAGFALSGFLLSAVLAQMVPMLQALGLGASALLVSALFGPAQVLVRFVNMIFGVRRHPLFITIVAASMLPAAALIVIGTAPMVAGAAIFAILLGFGSGLKSIVQGTLPLALFGSASYGERLGRMARVRQFLAAMAPFTFAVASDHFGAASALLLFVVVAALGLAAFVEVARIRRLAFTPAQGEAVPTSGRQTTA